MLENTEVAIKNGESRETGNQGYTRHKTKTHKTKTQLQYALDTTMRKNKLQTTGGKDDPNIVFMRKS
jgi:hypothetical protein